MNNQKRLDIDVRQIIKTLLSRKKLFLKVWVITFVLSCIWILPQPRYYTAKLSVAPETKDAMGGSGGGNLASLASSFGLNIGSSSDDAIYPQLYPDLFKSTNFLVGLLDIQVKTKDGEVETDYYTYLTKHQKENFLLLPLDLLKTWIQSLTTKEEEEPATTDGKRFNPFQLSKRTTDVINAIQGKITCNYSKTTDVVTISVTDQDPLVCATLADSVKEHLQVFITDYRTKKSRIDYEHYKKLTEDTRKEYDQARESYAAFADAHQDVYLQSVKTKMDNLENDMQLKYNFYSSANSRLEIAMAKVQENTPVFTTLTNATVPIKPAGPTRMIFVAIMLFLATMGTIVYAFHKELIDWF